jgi:hypothetical protein
MHILYVDESGDDGFSNNGDYSQPTPSKYFIRTGLIVHDKKWNSINTEIFSLKKKWKIPDNIELHASEIRSGWARSYNSDGKKNKVQNWYLQNYPNKNERIKILNSFCELIDSLNKITVICVAIDKTKIDITVNNYKELPKKKSWELMIERYNLFLNDKKDKIGIIISDAVQDKIEKQHREFAQGVFCKSTHVESNRFIETILFEPSDSSNLLQLVDLASYAFFRNFCSDDSFMIDLFKDKILKNERGSIMGAGLKIWPE